MLCKVHILKGFFLSYIYGKSGDLVLDKMENLLEHVFVDISVSFFLIKIQEK